MTKQEKVEKFLYQRCAKLGTEEEQIVEDEVFDDEAYIIWKKDLISFVNKLK